MATQGDVRIGVSGWRYTPWRGVFYPRGMPQRLELWYASRVLTTVEINGSFYSLQRPEFYRQWHDETPPEFRFAVKGPRFITHMKKLRDVKTPLANFFASGVFLLGRKLGPILWQLPPMFHFKPDLLGEFFEMLPRDLKAAARLAKKHDARLNGRSHLQIDANRKLRYALEIRHPSFVCPEFVALLRKHRIALVVAETAKRWPLLCDVTADFLYLRLHGDKELYKSGYSDAALSRWARRIRILQAGGRPTDLESAVPPAATNSAAKVGSHKKPMDVFCYFDNTDVKLRAPFDAISLARKLGGQRAPAPKWQEE